MAKLKQLYRSSIFYTFANTIEALTPIVLIPILTRYLSLHDYGLWALFQSVVAFLVPVLSLSFKDAIRMRYLALKPEAFWGFLISAATIMVAFGLIWLGVAFLFRDLLADWLKLRPAGLCAIIGITLCYGFFYMALAVFQFAGDRRTFAIIQGVQSVISISATLALVMLDSGWQGCVFGRLIGLSIAVLVAAWYLYHRFGRLHRLHISHRYVRELLDFGWRYLPAGVYLVVIPFTNRLFITNILGVDKTSLYAIAESLAMMLYLVVLGFTHAWQPWLFRKLAGHDEHGLDDIRKSCVLFVIGLPLAGGLMSIVAHFMMPYVLGEKFMEVDAYIFWLMMVVAAGGYFKLTQTFLHFYQRAALMSVCSLIAMIANGAMSWSFIQHYGVMGAAWSAMIAYLIAAVVGLVMVMCLRQRPVVTQVAEQ